MNDETQILTREEETDPKRDQSHICSLSVRALITLLVTITVCVMAFQNKKVEEPLYTVVGLCLGFYFGQRDKPKAQQ
jgi:hypothetical protein